MGDKRTFLEDRFENARPIEPGKIVVTYPGTQVFFSYVDGQAYVNAPGDVGYASVRFKDAKIQQKSKNGFVPGLGGLAGDRFADIVRGMQNKRTDDGYISKGPYYFFFSQDEDGRRFLTMPHMEQEILLARRRIAGVCVDTYRNNGGGFPVEQVYDQHMGRLMRGRRKLVTDRDQTIDAVVGIIPVVNRVYLRARMNMRQLAHY
jgi:hypothetical protein